MDDPFRPPHSHFYSGGSTRSGSSGSTSKRKITESEEEDVDITGLSTPTKRHQTESSWTRKETEDTAATTTTTTSISRRWNEQTRPSPCPWRREEINLLKGILDFYHTNGRYPYPDSNDLQNFFINWVQERGFYRDAMDLNRKMESLNLRFLTNTEKKSNGEDIEANMDPTEREIFRLSNRVWGRENDDDAMMVDLIQMM
ncbi:probable transcription factor At2g01370 [Cynara cardunculus var. scolymus]|uniref:probable transcription factor At2g01370 n=1 Tax=Cynara cardunculus var. scolymus TaxID=59895 RepID=UPI000D623844|nr:probable transcription factor At2g01370 [Cynara cardunculus var. scolymus]